MDSYIMTSEALTEGNLNKVCDLIANVIMYNYLAKDETSKVTVDVIINDKYLIVLGTIIWIYAIVMVVNFKKHPR